MPTGYEVPYDDPGSLGEQMLGKGDEKRSTKTFIEDGAMANVLGFLQGFNLMWLNDARRGLAKARNCTIAEVSLKDVLTQIPEAQEILEIHQRVIEHKGSQGGYLVDRFTGRQANEELERKEAKKGSSGEVAGASKWR